jgi:hypothetical protein
MNSKEDTSRPTVVAERLKERTTASREPKLQMTCCMPIVVLWRGGEAIDIGLLLFPPHLQVGQIDDRSVVRILNEN